MGVAAALADLDDDELGRLLERRPDLAVPPPRSFADLAERAGRSASLARCLEVVDQLCLQLLNVLAALPKAPALDDVAALLGPPATREDLAAGLGRLRALALVRGGDDAIHLVGEIHQQLGHPAGLGRPLATLLGAKSLAEVEMVASALGEGTRRSAKGPLVARLATVLADPATVASLRAMAPAEAGVLLDDLARGASPVVRRPEPAWNSRRPLVIPHLDWLHDRGLLVASGYGLSEVPREVGLAMRGGLAYRVTVASPPPIETTPVDPARVEATAAAAAAAALRTVGSVLRGFGATPAPALKAGGLGVRETKKAAKAVDLPERDLIRLLEVAHAGGLVDETEAGFVPTATFDAWQSAPPAERWVTLALAWRDAPTLPSLAGALDASGKAIPAFAPIWVTEGVVAQRRTVLEVLGRTAAGAAVVPETVTPSLAWGAPMRWSGRSGLPRVRVDDVVEEAALLGVTGAGALGEAGRALADDDLAGLRLAATRLLPIPPTEITLQADLTCVVPAGLESSVLDEVTLAADLESSGAALVHRFSEASIRRALDAGRSAEGIVAFLERHAPRGVPQSLAYLVRDVGRRHGALRVGDVASYLRSDDEALVAEVLRMKRAGALGLRRVAPTVLVSSASGETLLAALRTAGFLPAREGAHGEVVVTAPSQHRAAATPRPAGAPGRGPTAARDLETTALVAALRAGPAPEPPAVPGPSAVPDRRRPDADDLLAAFGEACDRGEQVRVVHTVGPAVRELVASVAGLTSSAVMLRPPYPAPPLLVRVDDVVELERLRSDPRGTRRRGGRR